MQVFGFDIYDDDLAMIEAIDGATFCLVRRISHEVGLNVTFSKQSSDDDRGHTQ
ncbi:hypothetical protein V1293_002915 [Bradyrhizobium sp. AZCC 1693]